MTENKLTHARTEFKPFRYPWAYDAWLAHESAHWLHSELPFHDDVNDYTNKLSEGHKKFITHIFRFFVQGDLDVAGAYVNNYLPVFPQPEIRMMLLGFAAREATHVAAYAHLIETLGLPETTYNEFMEYSAMKDKHDYVLDFVGKDKNTIAQQMAVFSGFTEGMQLFSSFILLLNFTRNGFMKSMGQVITWSISDENMHVEAMIRLFRTFITENPEIWNDQLKGEIYVIARRMTELEYAFIDLAFSVVDDMFGLTAESVKQYIRYICDRRLIQLGMKPIWGEKDNPMEWVDELLSIPIHGNFFETKVTEYTKGALTGSWNEVWKN